MKNYKFYLEFASPSHKRKGISKQNVLLTCGKYYINGSNIAVIESLSTVSCDPVPNTSEMCWSEASREYIWDNCIRISEKKAREIHPNLFKILAYYEPIEFTKQLKMRGGKKISFIDKVLTYKEKDSDELKTISFF